MVERNTSSIGYRMQNHYEIILNARAKLEQFKITGVDQAKTTNVTSMGGGATWQSSYSQEHDQETGR